MQSLLEFKLNKWAQSNDNTNLYYKLNYLLESFYKDLDDELIIEKLKFVKNDISIFNEVDNNAIYQIEDELIDQVDKIIEKMIYAIYDELIRYQQNDYYSGNYMPRMRPGTWGVRKLRREWIESLLNQPQIISERSNHPIANIIGKLARFGTQVKRLVVQHIRKMNDAQGIRTPNNLGAKTGSGSISTLDNLSNFEPYKFQQEEPVAAKKTPANGPVVKPMQNPRTPQPNTSNVQSNPNVPTNPQLVTPQQDAPTPTVSAPTVKPVSTTANIQNDEPVIPSNAPVIKPSEDIANKIKNEKDINKFITELATKKPPLLRGIYTKLTGQQLPRNAKRDEIINALKTWHMNTHGSPAPNPQTVNPVQSNVTSNKVVTPKVEPPKPIEKPILKSEPVKPVEPEVKPEPISRQYPIVNITKDGIEKSIGELAKIRKVNPVTIKPFLNKIASDPSVNISDYDLNDLYDLFKKGMDDENHNDSIDSIADYALNKIKKGKVNKIDPNEIGKPVEPKVEPPKSIEKPVLKSEPVKPVEPEIKPEPKIEKEPDYSKGYIPDADLGDEDDIANYRKRRKSHTYSNESKPKYDDDYNFDDEENESFSLLDKKLKKFKESLKKRSMLNENVKFDFKKLIKSQ